jgi:TetR/AcrR family transcriptional repressor of nem operon
MPWSPQHAERTRSKIVRAASRLFRRDGFAATGVDASMAAAGLTRGGFYAHFEDKVHLFADALESAFDEAEARLLDRRFAELRGEAWIEAAAGLYLDPRHRDAPERGCAIPPLGAEIARAPRRVRNVFTARVDRLVGRMAERIGGDGARARALRLLCTWVGALVLARAVTDAALSDEILDAARDRR